MIAFEVALNGVRLCTAGTGERGVVTVIVTLAGTPRDVNLEVGGLLDDSNLKWPVPRPPQVGDEIIVRVVETERTDPPGIQYPGARGFAEEQERQYYQQLKRKYEPGP